MQPVETFLQQAIELALDNVKQRHGRPFGCVVVQGDAVIATGVNEILSTGDPTAHAELQAIRAACRARQTVRLDGCRVYASGHPCPMCLAAMYLTGIEAVYCAYSNDAGAQYGLSTAAIYGELAKGPSGGALKVVCVPVRMNEDLYEVWQLHGAPARPPG
jgi:guanine deaminase